MTNKRNQPFFQTHVGVPQLFIRNTRECLSPRLSVPKFCVPIVPDMILNEVPQRRRDPCRRMNAVRDVTDRNFLDRPAGKKSLPEGTRNFTVFATHAVSRATHANSERR